jgi:hypothetical protein
MVLRFPDLEQSKNAVLNSLAAASSQESYRHAIDEFIGWYLLGAAFGIEPDRCAPVPVLPGAEQLRSFHHQCSLGRGAVTGYEAADSGLLSPEVAAGIRRVKGAKRLGVRIGNWLSIHQSRTLLQMSSLETARGKRDRAILGSVDWMRTQAGRTGRPEDRGPAESGGTLRYRRPDRQGEAHPYRSISHLGEASGRQMD